MTTAALTRAHTVHAEIQRLVPALQQHWHRLAVLLAEVRRDRLWQAFDCDSFDTYCADQHGINPRAAHGRAVAGERLLALPAETRERVQALAPSKAELVLRHPETLELAEDGATWQQLVDAGKQHGGEEEKPYARMSLWVNRDDKDELRDLLKEGRKLSGIDSDGGVVLNALREVVTDWQARQGDGERAE